MKRLLSWLLCMLMVVGMLPMQVSAVEETSVEQDEITTDLEIAEDTHPDTVVTEDTLLASNHERSGSAGRNVTWTMNNDGTLVFSGTGPMDDNSRYMVKDWNAWFAEEIVHIVLKEGITYIGEWSFNQSWKLSNLDSVTIPSTVTSIGEDAFINLGYLQRVKISNLEKWCSIEFNNGANPLCNYADLYINDVLVENLTIPASVSKIADTTFMGCTSIKTVEIPKTVTQIGSLAFGSCFNLQKIIFRGNAPEFGENVFTWSSVYAYYPANNPTWTSDVMQNYGGTVTWIPYDPKLDDVSSDDFPGDTTGGYVRWKMDEASGVLTIYGSGDMRNYYSNSLPLWKIYRDSITSIVIEEGVTGIGDYAFYKFYDVTSVSLPSTLTSIGEMAFYHCELSEIVFPENLKSIGSLAFGGCELIEIVFPPNLNSIGSEAFTHGNNLEKIVFTGKAPEESYNCLRGVSAVAYYPGKKEGWTEDVMRGYGGNIQWINSDHIHDYTVEMVLPTCTKNGYTIYTCVCGDTYTGNEIAALGHKYLEGKCSVCGFEAVDVTRVAGGSRYSTCTAVADELKATLDGKPFDAVVVASGADFPDALAGTYLAAVKKAPILLIADTHIDMMVDYIDKNMTDDGTIYILGSENSVSAMAEEALKTVGNVKRLGGKSRFITNLRILEEVNTKTGELLVVYSVAPWDALSVSSSGRPILLVNDKLRDDQKQYLETTGFDKITIIGSTAGVPGTMEEELRAYCSNIDRVYGKNRFMTSIEVAEYFYGTEKGSIVVACGTNFPDGLCSGALAHAKKAPVILTDAGRESLVADYVTEYNVQSGYVIGSAKVVSDASVRKAFHMTETDVIK